MILPFNIYLYFCNRSLLGLDSKVRHPNPFVFILFDLYPFKSIFSSWEAGIASSGQSFDFVSQPVEYYSLQTNYWTHCSTVTII